MDCGASGWCWKLLTATFICDMWVAVLHAGVENLHDLHFVIK